ncbi:MAG: hypothetical protein A2Z72_08100 [Omnitrophica bacterium RBG_13_46_9]|nr:MAG: hypothetical protein A2Z72_08100 [Omnitrophica bacterium RBG_13_46_9]
MRTYPFVSVIIPVFNASQRLEMCLEALTGQTYPGDFYEIIVVDNNSDQDIEGVVRRFDRAIYAFEACSGSYTARNRGVSLSKGDIIAFTDSDCMPAQDWIQKGVSRLLGATDYGLVAGKINFSFKDPNRPTAVELYDSVTYLQQKEHVERDGFGTTANLFTFRKIIDRVGPFDDTLKSGGDRQWGQRASSFGYKPVYADDVNVTHPAVYSIVQLCKRRRRVTGGLYGLRKREHCSFCEHGGILAKRFFGPLSNISLILKDRRVCGVRRRIKLIFIVLLVDSLASLEKIRLALGGKPERH